MFGFGTENCTLAAVGNYPMVYFKHKAISSPSTHTTENYTADINGNYTIAFQMTSPNESLRESSVLFSKIIKSVK
jgi:hypothetical protein